MKFRLLFLILCLIASRDRPLAANNRRLIKFAKNQLKNRPSKNTKAVLRMVAKSSNPSRVVLDTLNHLEPYILTMESNGE